MKKLFCDIDSTVNNHWERIRRFTKNGSCDWDKAFSREETVKDKVLPDAKESLKKLAEEYEIHFLTARFWDGAYEMTKEWLDKNNFEYKSLIVVKKPMDKLQYVTETDSLFIDDFSRAHDKHPPYKILHWDVIRELNKHNVNYRIFKGDWKKIIEGLV